MANWLYPFSAVVVIFLFIVNSVSSDTNLCMPGSELDKQLSSECRMNNETDLECSGRGTCACGVCLCKSKINPNKRIYGKYCECDNFSCDEFREKLCGGPERGECECGTCKCQSGWTGSACECATSNDTCIAPNSDVICSGKGKCECGECSCLRNIDNDFRGKYCQRCESCFDCHDFKQCVECHLFNARSQQEIDYCKNNCSFPITTIDKLNLSRDGETICMVYTPYNINCGLFFLYYLTDDNKIELHTIPQRDCRNNSTRILSRSEKLNF